MDQPPKSQPSQSCCKLFKNSISKATAFKCSGEVALERDGRKREREWEGGRKGREGERERGGRGREEREEREWIVPKIYC